MTGDVVSSEVLEQIAASLRLPWTIRPAAENRRGIDEECWVPAVRETDALLVWGGDPVFLAYWMRRSGLAGVLPSLPSETVYLGVSAGSIAATSTFAETYREPRRGSGEALSTEDIVSEGHWKLFTS
jgi:Peptidase family S51